MLNHSELLLRFSQVHVLQCRRLKPSARRACQLSPWRTATARLLLPMGCLVQDS